MSTYSSNNNKRITKNTLLLYFRMLFMMVVSLYTSRVILNALGVEDFGIYNVAGGVVAMFSIISILFNAAISRFVTYELGRENNMSIIKGYNKFLTTQMNNASKSVSLEDVSPNLSTNKFYVGFKLI